MYQEILSKAPLLGRAARRQLLLLRGRVDAVAVALQAVAKSDHLRLGAGAKVPGSRFGRYVSVHERASVIDSYVGDYTYVGVASVVRESTIGKFCSIAPEVFVGLVNHPTEEFVSSHPAFFLSRPGTWEFVNSDLFKEPPGVTVGNDVWIGHRALIMSSLTIGDGAVVGAGAIVTKDVPPYGVAVGVPARLIRYRFDHDTIEELLKIAWWDWEHDRLLESIDEMHDVRAMLSRNNASTPEGLQGERKTAMG